MGIKFPDDGFINETQTLLTLCKTNKQDKSNYIPLCLI